MWMTRAILLVVLGAFLGADSFLLRRRRKYSRLTESRTVNIALVAAHLTVTCALVALPPVGGYRARPDWLRPATVCLGFGVLGAALVCAGLGLAFLALHQRKAVGLQNSPNGLITSCAYRYFRHPIYTGILWMSLGLALLTRNPDGLAMFPLIFLAYLTLMLLEERDDMGPAFAGQYQVYRQTVRILGPAWLWATILVAMALTVVFTWIWGN